jgi:hypothetical protein
MDLYTSTVFVGGLALGAVLGVTRRYLLRVPRLIGRRLKIMPRRAKILGRKTGAAGLSSHPKLQGDLPAIRRELHIIDDPQPGANAIFDFSEADRQLVVQRHGFKAFRQPKSELTDADCSDDERNVGLARRFFSSAIQIETDAENLYDEEEGAVIVRMLRRSDRMMLYAIDKFRCVVGDNARRMIGDSLFAVLSFVLAAVGVQLAINFGLVPTEMSDALKSPWSIAVVAVATAIVLYSLLRLWVRNLNYTKARDAGLSEFKSLLQGYFAGASDKFVNAHAKMSHSILGEEDQDFLAESAEKSHKTMLWHAMRVLFMENFLRNEYYQMRRNLRFYQMAFRCGALVFVLAGVGLVEAVGPVFQWGWPEVVPAILLAGAAIAAWLIWMLSIGKRDTEAQISDLHWRGFEELHMDERLREIIGAYAKEAGIGKHRFSRGKGG